MSSKLDLSEHGIAASGTVRRNLAPPALITAAVRAGTGVLAEGGALVVDTGKKTGRSADDKFLVREPGSEARIWWGEVNKPLEPGSFECLRAKVVSHLDGRDSTSSTRTPAPTLRTGWRCGS